MPTATQIVFLASCFVRFTLPHRRAAESTFARRDGSLTAAFSAPAHIGLPYGRWPRLILIYLTTQAVRTRSRDINLDSSMQSFMRQFGILATGGVNGSIQIFKEQLLKTASTSLTVSSLTELGASLSNRPLADAYTLRWDAICSDGGNRQPATIRLGERVFHEMIRSAVPLDLRAIKALQQSPFATDLYCWLTFRVRSVKGPTRIPIAEFQTQFGVAYATSSDFKRAFATALHEVSFVYPALNFRLVDSTLILLKSRTSVPAAGGSRTRAV